jgi:hypothetical protein
MIFNAIGHEQLSYFIIIHLRGKKAGNIKLECWFQKVSTEYNSGLTKPGEVGDFFALVSMKSPNFCRKAKF